MFGACRHFWHASIWVRPKSNVESTSCQSVLHRPIPSSSTAAVVTFYKAVLMSGTLFHPLLKNDNIPIHVFFFCLRHGNGPPSHLFHAIPSKEWSSNQNRRLGTLPFNGTMEALHICFATKSSLADLSIIALFQKCRLPTIHQLRSDMKSALYPELRN